MDPDSASSNSVIESSRWTKSEFSRTSTRFVKSRAFSHYDGNRNWNPDSSVLHDVKSLYEAIHAKKKMVGNPNEPFIHRFMVTGELMEHYQRPDARNQILFQIERLARENSAQLRQRGEDPVTGFALIYPTQIFLVMESNWWSLRNIIQKWRALESDPKRIVVQYRILNVACDVTRQMRNFHSKLLNQPMPLPNWLPQGGVTETAAETALKLILRQAHEMMKFIALLGNERKVMDLLVEQRPETLPDQDPLLYVSRSQLPMTSCVFLERFVSPCNLHLAVDETWPNNWSGKRLSCQVTFRDDNSVSHPVYGVKSVQSRAAPANS